MDYPEKIGFMRIDIEGKYSFYVDGTLYSHQRGKWHKPILDSRGYMTYNLSLRNGRRHRRIHRMIAEYFIPNPFGYETVNHIDGNKLNNHAENLEWCTLQQNLAHAYKNGLMNPGRTLGAKDKKTVVMNES